MANNRMFIHCKVCDTYEHVCSHLTTGWNVDEYDLACYIERHGECFYVDYDTLQGEIFEFKYENSMSLEEWNKALSHSE